MDSSDHSRDLDLLNDPLKNMHIDIGFFKKINIYHMSYNASESDQETWSKYHEVAKTNSKSAIHEGWDLATPIASKKQIQQTYFRYHILIYNCFKRCYAVLVVLDDFIWSQLNLPNCVTSFRELGSTKANRRPDDPPKVVPVYHSSDLLPVKNWGKKCALLSSTGKMFIDLQGSN